MTTDAIADWPDAIDRALGLYLRDPQAGLAGALDGLAAVAASGDRGAAAVARINRQVLGEIAARNAQAAERPAPADRILAEWQTGDGAPARVENPRVSVIMPTWNRDPRVLAASVASALNQDRVAHEVVVVNDGGDTAGIETALRTVFRRDARLRVIEATHGGTACALNVGQAAARGDVLAYLDDDDRYHPHHLACAVDALESAGEAAGILTQFAKVTLHADATAPDGWREHSRGVHYRATAVASADYRGRMHVPNRGPMVHHRRLLERVGGGFCERVRYAEDWEFALRVSRRAAWIGLDTVTGEYMVRVGGQQKTRQRTPQMVEDWNVILGLNQLFPLSGPVLRGRAGRRLAASLAAALEWHPDVIRALELRVLFTAAPWRLLRELSKLFAKLGEPDVARAAAAEAARLRPLFPLGWLSRLRG